MGQATKSQPPMRVVRMVVGEEIAGVVVAPVSRWKTWALVAFAVAVLCLQATGIVIARLDAAMIAAHEQRTREQLRAVEVRIIGLEHQADTR